LRESVVKNLSGQPWGKALVNVFVRDGVVDLWGLVQTDEERRAIRVTAESTPGVRAVNDNLRINTFVSGL
jgi:osmotically-inducible protein OsmY